MSIPNSSEDFNGLMFNRVAHDRPLLEDRLRLRRGERQVAEEARAAARAGQRQHGHGNRTPGSQFAKASGVRMSMPLEEED